MVPVLFVKMGLKLPLQWDFAVILMTHVEIFQSLFLKFQFGRLACEILFLIEIYKFKVGL